VAAGFESALVSDTLHDRLILVNSSGHVTPVDSVRIRLPGKIRQVGDKVMVIDGWTSKIRVLTADKFKQVSEFGGPLAKAGWRLRLPLP